jgi:hypothetical protein
LWDLFIIMSVLGFRQFLLGTLVRQFLRRTPDWFGEWSLATMARSMKRRFPLGPVRCGRGEGSTCKPRRLTIGSGGPDARSQWSGRELRRQ